MRVSVREILRNFAFFGDKALSAPVIITKNGRDRLVLISVEEYAMLRDLMDDASEDAAESVKPVPGIGRKRLRK